MRQENYRKLLYLLFFIIPLAFCKAPIIATNSENNSRIENWQESALTIDGLDSDWNLNQCRIDSINQLIYKISNDSNFLYVCLKSNNDCMKMRILEAGMCLYVNSSGKKKETAGIVFPIANRTSYKPIYRKISKIDSSNMYKYINDLKEYSIFGLGGIGSSKIYSYEDEENNKLNIKVKAGFNKKLELVYEAAIPLTLLNTTTVSGITKPCKTVALEIVVNPFERPSTVNDFLMPNINMLPIFKGMPAKPEDFLFKETKIWSIANIATHQ